MIESQWHSSSVDEQINKSSTSCSVPLRVRCSRSCFTAWLNKCGLDFSPWGSLLPQYCLPLYLNANSLDSSASGMLKKAEHQSITVKKKSGGTFVRCWISLPLILVIMEFYMGY